MDQVLKKLNTTEKPGLIAENLFLLLLGVYMVYLFTFNTTYYFLVPLSIARILLFLMLAAGGARIILKNLWSRRFLLALVLGVVYVLVYFQLKDIRFLFLAVVTVGCVDLDYHHAAKVCAAVGITCLLLTFAATFSGAIENLVYLRKKGAYLRSSWGMGYPTDMSAFLLMMISTSWIAWKEFPDELAVIGALFSVWVAYAIAASRTSLASSLFFLLVVCWHMLETRASGNSTFLKSRHSFEKISAFLKKLMVYAFPFFAVCFLILVVGYAKELPGFDRIDSMLSRRLQYTLHIFLEEGLHPFGIYFYNVGNGGNTIEPPSVYFLDSSYALILIQYGWVLFAAVAVIWCYRAETARKNKDYRLLMVMTLVCVQSFAEHHFLEANFNILAVLLFSRIPDQWEDHPYKEMTFMRFCKVHACGALACLGTAIIIALLAPVQLGRIRTLLTISGYSATLPEKLRLVGQYLVAFVLIFVPIWTISYLLTENKKQQKTTKTFLIAMPVLSLLCVASAVFIARSEKTTIEIADPRYTSMIRADTQAMEIILENAEGVVYAESVPEIYQLHFDGLSRPLFCGDDLARLKQATILTDLSINRQRFTEMGFEFSVISRYHAVYSNDSSVIASLREAGYEWSDYYSVAFDLDLNLVSEMNEIPITETGTLFLNGPVDAIINGPGLDLYAGVYLLSYELQTMPAQPEDQVICTIQVSDFYDGRILTEHPVTAGEFNEEGWMQGGITFRTSGSRNTEFRFIPEEGQQLEVAGIRYQKISN